MQVLPEIYSKTPLPQLDEDKGCWSNRGLSDLYNLLGLVENFIKTLRMNTSNNKNITK